MEKLPENWINKLFDCMSKFYGKRWDDKFNDPFVLDLHKTIWNNGLDGLSYDQIRHGLAVCKKNSHFSYSKPPTVVKFFHFCLGL